MKNALQRQVSIGSSKDALLSFDFQKVALYLQCAQVYRRSPAFKAIMRFEASLNNEPAVKKIRLP